MDKILDVKRPGIYGKRPLYKVRDIKTIRGMFDESCELFKEKELFLVKNNPKDSYRKITYGETKEMVYAFANYLIDIGLKGKKIMLIGENRYEWEIAYLAIVGGVGCVVPTDKELPYEELNYIREMTEADAIVYTDKIYKKNPGFFDEFQGIKINLESFESLIEKGKTLPDEFKNAKVMPDDVNIILFTSGTTGKAKGIMLSHKNVANNLMNMCSMTETYPWDRFFSLLPLHHTYECTCGFLCPIYRGSSIAFCSGLKYITKEMKESEPTIILLVPLIAESIYRQIKKGIKKENKEGKVKFARKVSGFLLKFGIDVRRRMFKEILDNLGGKLRLFIMGGASVDPEVGEGFRSFGVYSVQGYGLTECAPIVALNREYTARDDSLGQPLPESLLEIYNPDKNGIGELRVKGDNVMVGYYKNEEATKEVLKDGWFYTGDLGYEKDGFFYLTGRKKYVIVTANGENVFPEEVESYLLKEEIIKECLVYAKKDEKGNDNLVAAHIFPDFDYVKEKYGENFSKEELKEELKKTVKEVNSKMPSFKSIVDFDIREEEFKKTTSNKIKRFEN